MARPGGLDGLIAAALGTRGGSKGRRPRGAIIEIERSPHGSEDESSEEMDDMEDDGLEYGSSEDDDMGDGYDEGDDTGEGDSDPDVTPERLRCADDAFRAIESGDRRGFVEAVLAIAGK